MLQRLKRFPFFGIVLVVALTSHILTAQDCPISIQDLINTAQSACTNLSPGQACYGAGQISLTPTADASVTFTQSGDMADLSAIQSLDIGSVDAKGTDWGVVLIKTNAGLPNGATPVTLAVFGGAQMTNLVKASSGPAVTLKMQNIAGYTINLRKGAGTTFPVAGSLPKKGEATLDGRNEAADWFRVQTDAGPAWVHKSLIKIEGDPTTLPVIDSPYTLPMQAFTLTTTPNPACGAAYSGLLMQGANDQQTARLQVNGAELAFSQATVLVQAQADSTLDAAIVDGKVTVTANNTAVDAEAGTAVSVKLKGLEPAEAPQAAPSYSFAAVDGVPFNLVGGTSAGCIAGLEGSGDVPKVYSGPGAEYRQLTSLKADAHYSVVGWATGSDKQAWWKLSTGRSTLWVPQNAVRTQGACESVAQVDAPPLVSSASGDQSASFVPDGRSIWQANSGVDNVSGVCVQPPLALCAHLAAITKNGDGSITWRGQEPTPYVLQKTGPNTYSYSGRHALGTGTASLTLTFTSDSEWKMTYSSVFDNDPQCTHTFYYTATREW